MASAFSLDGLASSYPLSIPDERAEELDDVSDSKSFEKVIATNYLESWVPESRLQYIWLNSFYTPRCIDALFGVRIPFQSLVQGPELNPDSSPPVESPVMFTQVKERPLEQQKRLYITFGALGL